MRPAPSAAFLKGSLLAATSVAERLRKEPRRACASCGLNAGRTRLLGYLFCAGHDLKEMRAQPLRAASIMGSWLADAYADAGRTMACNMMDESALEGVQAFVEKRPPRW